MIEIENVSLMIGHTQILQNINLVFEKGMIHGLIGRNGSGKTMLMKCICGFVRVSEGIIRVSGSVIGKDIDYPKDTGIIIEHPGFIPYYSGYKNLRILGSLKKEVDSEKICEVMHYVGLDASLKRHVNKYSLGMRQRLGLAQAIMEEPSLLILDEPFNGLDKEGVVEMRKYLFGIKEKGTTILLSSHSEEDIRILCDDVVEMDNGRVSF